MYRMLCCMYDVGMVWYRTIPYNRTMPMYIVICTCIHNMYGRSIRVSMVSYHRMPFVALPRRFIILERSVSQ